MIMRQDLWALQGHGQRDPLQTPAQVLEIKIICDIVWHCRVFLSILAYDIL